MKRRRALVCVGLALVLGLGITMVVRGACDLQYVQAGDRTFAGHPLDLRLETVCVGGTPELQMKMCLPWTAYIHLIGRNANGDWVLLLPSAREHNLRYAGWNTEKVPLGYTEVIVVAIQHPHLLLFADFTKIASGRQYFYLDEIGQLGLWRYNSCNPLWVGKITFAPSAGSIVRPCCSLPAVPAVPALCVSGCNCSPVGCWPTSACRCLSWWWLVTFLLVVH